MAKKIDIRFPTSGTAKIVETVTLAEFDMGIGYDLDGTIVDVIERLQHYQQEGIDKGLVNIRMVTDYEDVAIYEYGGYQGNYEKKWTTIIKGDKDD